MKLINKTIIPDQILISVLSDAALSLGIKLRTTQVVVYVYKTSYYGSRGIAYRCSMVRWDHRFRKTDKGAIKIGLHIGLSGALSGAINFFETARHEWGHIYDYQYKGKKELIFTHNPRHDNRPQERRVYEYINNANQKGNTRDKYYESIMALAVSIEQNTLK
jgi:hypothetical protein